jgi:AraC family transcriptional regulator
MEKAGAVMDKTGSAQSVGADHAALLSPQVREGRYFFLELAPRGRGRDVVLAFGGYESCRSDYRLQRGSFAYYGLELIMEGAGSVRLGERRATIGPGSVFAYAPDTNVEIASDARRPLGKYFVCLSGAGVAARLKRARVPVGRVVRVAAPGEVRSVCDDLIREGQWHGPLTREVCAALGELLLLKTEAGVRAAAGGGAADPARERFLRCKALIDANAERLLSLEELAEAAALDVSTVCRLFRRFQGGSPYQYLLRRKMNLAAEFLMELGGLVKEAAQRVGFADAYHFSRVFKAVHGVAPRDLQGYRRAH